MSQLIEAFEQARARLEISERWPRQLGDGGGGHRGDYK